jgi:hypothetical protein
MQSRKQKKMSDKLIEAIIVTTFVILSIYITLISLEFIIRVIWKFIKQ